MPQLSEPRPKVSVIIPVYNHEGFVAEAIAGVFNQTFQDFEIIAIDDGSTDSSLDTLKTFTDTRMQVHTQNNIGAARTINKGISLARGEYITILNSDDKYHPERLEVMSRYLDEHPTTLLAASLVQPIDAAGKEIEQNQGHDLWLHWYENALTGLKEERSFLYSLVKYNYLISTSNIFIRAAFFEDHKAFNELLAYCHDYEFLLRAVREDSFFLFDKQLLQYRLHGSNTIRENEFLRHLEVLYSLACFSRRSRSLIKDSSSTT